MNVNSWMVLNLTVVTKEVKFLVWENTTRKELQPLELTSKVTTEFAYNGTSRAGVPNQSIAIYRWIFKCLAVDRG